MPRSKAHFVPFLLNRWCHNDNSFMQFLLADIPIIKKPNSKHVLCTSAPCVSRFFFFSHCLAKLGFLSYTAVFLCGIYCVPLYIKKNTTVSG